MQPESTPPGGTLPSRRADITVDDWDAMLCAVRDRLRLAVGEAMTVPLNGSAAPVRATVLDCVEALDQLHATLTQVLAGADRIDIRPGDRDAVRVAALGPGGAALAPSVPTTAVAATGLQTQPV